MDGVHGEFVNLHKTERRGSLVSRHRATVEFDAAAKACKDATSTTPIVFTLAADPVADGLVASIAHPGGNLTGLTMTTGYELAGKRLELLKDMVGGLSRVAVLIWGGVCYRSTVSGELSVVCCVTCETGEETAAVGRAHARFNVIFGMRHDAEHVAALVDDAGNRVGRAVVIPRGIEGAVRRAVAKQHAALAFQASDGVRIGDIITLAMSGRHFYHFAGIVAAREGRIRTLNAQMNIAAEEAQLHVAHQNAGQESRLARDLKAIAHREHEAALAGVRAHGQAG
jgi:hypothetical protein